MNEPFILELAYQNRHYEFPAAFQRYGYTYRIVVTMEEVNYIFEPDEEGLYRVIGTPTASVDLGLLRAVAEKLRRL
ncbi:hypothetical protein [Mucilaginibacter segetis]|uniref:Uncharacterized protein n=1 Tax=Mucilaginibacter segetis TaxID=2793071 RepID=A0A934PTI3_9SPHI|nr:hypothetical protein [Mucilaginibacter segetis]MBK0379272.1 hypothetical protein [Mucilaginibacter segetis]